MQQTIKDLLERRSIRKYKAQPILDEELEMVLECGVFAPTAKGEQSPRIVAVRDAALVARLSKLNAAVLGKDTDPFYGAPVAVVVFAKRGDPNSVQDASLVMGNMMNAAYAIGLGSCWINRAREMFSQGEGARLREEWGLADYDGVGICILGYPDGEAPAPKPRKADYVLHLS